MNVKCRFCDKQEVEKFIDLGLQPPSNALIDPVNLFRVHKFMPLQVGVCKSCWLAQTFDTVEPETFFNESYPYFSGQSQAWINHCNDFAKFALMYFELDSDSSILEIGSNDGTGLVPFKNLKCFIQGVDPSKSVSDYAESIMQVPTHNDFFGMEYRNKWKRCYDLIIARNVLAHVPNINDFLEAVKHSLFVEGTVVFEFPSLLNLLDNNQFDTIYHEHFSYLSFTVVNKMLRKHGMVAYRVEKLWTHGGSYRVFATRNGDIYPQQSIEETLLEENENGVNVIAKYHLLSIESYMIKKQFIQFLFNHESEVVIGYGASAKASTFLNYCGIKSDMLRYVADSSEHKINTLMPGSNILIIDEKMIKELKPNYIIIFSWNFKIQFIQKLYFAREWGCKFITFIPRMTIE